MKMIKKYYRKVKGKKGKKMVKGYMKPGKRKAKAK